MRIDDRRLRWLSFATAVAVACLFLTSLDALYFQPLEMRAAALGALAILLGAAVLLLAAVVASGPLVHRLEMSNRHVAAQTAALLRTCAQEMRAHAQAAAETATAVKRARRLLPSRSGGFHWDRDAVGNLVEGCADIERDFSRRALEFPAPDAVGAALDRAAGCARVVIPRLRQLVPASDRNPVAVQNEVVTGLDELEQALEALSALASARMGEIWSEVRRAESEAMPAQAAEPGSP